MTQLKVLKIATHFSHTDNSLGPMKFNKQNSHKLQNSLPFISIFFIS